MRWNEDAFARLVLPHGYKDIIYAFVQEQLSDDSKFDDIIDKKGEQPLHPIRWNRNTKIPTQVWASLCY